MDELQRILIENNEIEGQNQKKDLHLAKSLDYLRNRFEFIEEDENGMKLRVKTDYYRGDFPFETGFLVVSEYDDRRFLVTKVDPENKFIWFGLWEDS